MHPKRNLEIAWFSRRPAARPDSPGFHSHCYLQYTLFIYYQLASRSRSQSLYSLNVSLRLLIAPRNFGSVGQEAALTPKMPISCTHLVSLFNAGSGLSSISILLPNGPSSPDLDPPNPMEGFVKSATLALVDVWNTPNFRHPILDYLVPGFFSNQEGIAMTTDKQACLDVVRQVHSSNPSCQQKVVDVVAKCNDRRAMVWVTLEIYGFPDGLVRENVSVFYWARKGGKWTCYQHASVKGLSLGVVQPGHDLPSGNG